MAGQYFGTLGYDRGVNPLEGAASSFTQNYAAARAQKQQEQFNAQELALKQTEQHNDLMFKKAELKMRKAAAKDEQEKMKLERAEKGLDILAKGVQYGTKLLESNPQMTQEEYAEKMGPIQQIISASGDARSASLLLSRDEAAKLAQQGKTESVMTQEQAREAALSGQQIPRGATILPAERAEEVPEETQLTKADLEMAKKLMPDTMWGLRKSKDRQSIEEAARAQLLKKVPGKSKKESATDVDALLKKYNK